MSTRLSLNIVVIGMNHKTRSQHSDKASVAAEEMFWKIILSLVQCPGYFIINILSKAQLQKEKTAHSQNIQRTFETQQ